jgi:hypothetical protein
MASHDLRPVRQATERLESQRVDLGIARAGSGDKVQTEQVTAMRPERLPRPLPCCQVLHDPDRPGRPQQWTGSNSRMSARAADRRAGRATWSLPGRTAPRQQRPDRDRWRRHLPGSRSRAGRRCLRTTTGRTGRAWKPPRAQSRCHRRDRTLASDAQVVSGSLRGSATPGVIPGLPVCRGSSLSRGRLPEPRVACRVGRPAGR